MKLTNEPNMNEIDDYNNNESPEKRRTINLIMGTLIFIGIISYFYLR
jgi:hypothetical protein